MSGKVEPRLLSVTEVTREVRNSLEANPELTRMGVRGEVANFKLHNSGHMYFSLKDTGATLRCVMFRGQNRRLGFSPRDGQEVIALGSVGVFAPAGLYQLYVEAMEPAGMGSMHLAFEELKKRLHAEGLFDEGRKQPLPFLPRRVGVVTSPAGAAIRDIVSVARRRYSNVNLVLAPVLVQGSQAPQQMIDALRRLSRLAEIDVIILGRGGGSLEELWAFNDEQLAREVAACPLPVVTAVGHETDYTIVDFVADVRAPTPSAAAEIVIPSRSDLVHRIDRLQSRCGVAVARLLQQRRQQWERLRARRPLADPWFRFRQRRELVDAGRQRLDRTMAVILRERRQRWQAVKGRLESVNPLAVLERGFSLVCDQEGNVVRRAETVQEGQELWIYPARGSLQARVERVRDKGVGQHGESEL